MPYCSSRDSTVAPCAVAWVENIATITMAVRACLKTRIGEETDSDGVRPSSGAATRHCEGRWRIQERWLVVHCCGRGRPHSGSRLFKQLLRSFVMFIGLMSCRCQRTAARFGHSCASEQFKTITSTNSQVFRLNRHYRKNVCEIEHLNQPGFAVGNLAACFG